MRAEQDALPSSPGEANADLTVARENDTDTHHNLDRLERSVSTAGETETGGTEIVQIQAHNKALNEFNQLQRERERRPPAAWSVAREGAKASAEAYRHQRNQVCRSDSKPAPRL